MTWQDYDNLLSELEWLKKNHPEKRNLINFVERFGCFIKEEQEKEHGCQVQVRNQTTRVA